MVEAPSKVEAREVALNDVVLNDTALDNTVLEDVMLNDMALNVGVARLPSTDPPNEVFTLPLVFRTEWRGFC